MRMLAPSVPYAAMSLAVLIAAAVLIAGVLAGEWRRRRLDGEQPIDPTDDGSSSPD